MSRRAETEGFKTPFGTRRSQRGTVGRRCVRSTGTALAALLVCGFLLPPAPTAHAQQREIRPEALSLMEAVRDGDLPSIRALVAGGADLNEPLFSGMTALALAILSDQPEVVETLLELGAEVTPEAEGAAIAAGGRHTEDAAVIVGLLDQARGIVAEAPPSPGVDRDDDVIHLEGPGTYSGRFFTGPCSFETTRSTQEPRPGVQERSRSVRTIFFPEDRVPDVPARVELRPGDQPDMRTLLQLVPVGSPGTRRSVRPPDCEPVELGPGVHAMVVETTTIEDIWECSPLAGPACGWWILSPQLTAVEREVVGGIATAGVTVANEPERDDAPEEPEELRADPGGPYVSSRGAFLELDGTGSTGDIVRFTWTFVRGPRCPEYAPFQEEAEKTGATPSVVLLCDTQITLTVEDGSGGTHSASTRAELVARPWEVHVQHVEEDLHEHDTEVVVVPQGNADFRLEMSKGENVRYPERARIPSMLLVPESTSAPRFPARAAGRTWQHHADLFEFEQVRDEGGPFDGFFLLVREPTLAIWRRAVINQYLLPDGRPPRGHSRNFFQYNLESDPKFSQRLEGILEIIRAHEREHTRLMDEGIRAARTMARIEELYGDDEDRLRERIDVLLEEGELQAYLQAFEMHDHAAWEDGLSLSGLRFPVAGGQDGEVRIHP